jgi:hypothetical protein
MTTPVFLDLETTGLDPDRNEIWEIGLITPKSEQFYFLRVDLLRADPIALDIGRFHERHPQGNSYPHTKVPMSDTLFAPNDKDFLRSIARQTHGCHLAGAVISFDEERLRRLMLAAGVRPSWHYHLIDVEALAAGYLAHGYDHDGDAPHKPPWNSNELSQCIGVDPQLFERHTALGDCRWAKAIYEKVMCPVTDKHPRYQQQETP